MFVVILWILFYSCNPSSPQEVKWSKEDFIYTRHARCRMECRQITEAEVWEIYAQQRLNIRKSNSKGKPCPTKAYEGFSSDGQHCRIVIGECETQPKVITVIDLGKDHECTCP